MYVLIDMKSSRPIFAAKKKRTAAQLAYNKTLGTADVKKVKQLLKSQKVKWFRLSQRGKLS